MPSVLNFFRGKVEAILRLARLWQPDTRPFSVLGNASGVLKPVRALPSPPPPLSLPPRPPSWPAHAHRLRPRPSPWRA